jgi:type II secretion system protein J
MRCRRGFTLVELLVTTSMLGLLAAGGLAALTTGTRSAAKAKRYGAMVAHGQATLQAMATDIRAAVEHGDFQMISLDARYEGLAADTIDFIAADRVRLAKGEPGVGGRCEIGYYIENDPDTEVKWLLRREDSTLDDDPLEGGAVSLAGPHVAELNLEFYDGLYWESGWEEKTGFPEAVRIQVVVVDEDEIENPMVFNTTVPIMAQ